MEEQPFKDLGVDRGFGLCVGVSRLDTELND